jgi:hypothetical protein
VVASARNGSGGEIARAERVWEVLHALRASPVLMGLPRGGSATVRFSLAAPLDDDLAIDVAASNTSVAVGASEVVLPAGQTAVDIVVTACTECPNDPLTRVGAAAGNAAVVATSARGTAAAIVSVSDPVAGQALTAMARLAGLAIALPPSAGQIVTTAGRQDTTVVTVLGTPAGEATPVSVTSSNPGVASAIASTIPAGEQVTTLSITTGSNGTAILTLRAGDTVRSFTVIVGTPAPNQTPIALAPIVGVALPALPFIGQAITAVGAAVTLRLVLLAEPAAEPRAITVTSSDTGVVQVVSQTVTIPAGSRVAAIDILTGAAGRATLMILDGGLRRDFTVLVGQAPSPATSPVTAAAPVGVSVVPSPGIGRLVAPAGSAVTAPLGVQLLRSPRSVDVPVTVTSSDPGVVTVGTGGTAALVIPAGSLVLPITLGTLGVEGAALLSFEFEGQRLDVLVVVGNPLPSQLPAVVAPVLGVEVQQ